MACYIAHEISLTVKIGPCSNIAMLFKHETCHANSLSHWELAETPPP